MTYRELHLNSMTDRELLIELQPHLLQRLHEQTDADVYEYGQLLKQLFGRHNLDASELEMY